MGSSELLSSTGLMTNSVKEAACFDRSKLLCCSYRGFPKFAVNKSILFYSRGFFFFSKGGGFWLGNSPPPYQIVLTEGARELKDQGGLVFS